MHTRKRFGQHFLHDQSVLTRIVSAVNPQPGEHVVEIGPGAGALTALLTCPTTSPHRCCFICCALLMPSTRCT